MLQRRLATSLRPPTLSRSLHRSPPPARFAPSPPPPPPAPRLQSARSRYHTHSQLRYALLPIFLTLGGSGSLLLDTSKPDIEPKHSLKSILDAVEKPEADEFLIAVGSADRRQPPGFVRKVWWFLREWVWEPLSTSARFLQLAVLFLPVIITAPVLAFDYAENSRDRRRGKEKRTKNRATTRLWYRLLVHQMELAGPTFIKVCCSSPPSVSKQY